MRDLEAALHTAALWEENELLCGGDDVDEGLTGTRLAAGLFLKRIFGINYSPVPPLAFSGLGTAGLLSRTCPPERRFSAHVGVGSVQTLLEKHRRRLLSACEMDGRLC